MITSYNYFYIDHNTNNKQFLIEYQIQIDVFQETSLLNIVTKYETKIYDKYFLMAKSK